MATYVFSDVHGHIDTLKRAFEQVSPSADDQIIMLGDMIDRGPDPVGVMQFCRNLALDGATVLMGNHEDLMLSYFACPKSFDAQANWFINGGNKTLHGLEKISSDEQSELLEWVSSLPLSTHVRVGDRLYLLVHAGIMPQFSLSAALFDNQLSDDEKISFALKNQRPEDLMWVRHEFWSRRSGFINKDGEGIIVIAGHTPTPYLDGIADKPDRSGIGSDGLGQLVKVGACKKTGQVADRWDIDCGCAGGYGFGKLLILRLDDGREFYEPVREGE